jgi:hypothetical protein
MFFRSFALFSLLSTALAGTGMIELAESGLLSSAISMGSDLGGGQS